jgi:hypothetical protein
VEQLDLLQFGSLMGSLNRHHAASRVSRVYDTAVGAQGDEKGMKAHVKAIRAAVGQQDPNALGSRAFNARFGMKGPAKNGG